jgi:electron transfer flavoprotein beta subunit
MAPGDARALEMALKLTPRPIALHAGDAANASLRDYLGMGLDRIEVLGPWVEGADAVPMLAGRLREIGPDVVLTGAGADEGEASGMVPYLIARDLGMRHVSGIAEIETIDGKDAVCVQAYKGAPRRRLAATLPLVISASELAPAPRARAFGKSRRGSLVEVQAHAGMDHEAASWSRVPARRRPKKIAVGQSTGTGVPLVDLEPREAAQRIVAFLRDKGIIQENSR